MNPACIVETHNMTISQREELSTPKQGYFKCFSASSLVHFKWITNLFKVFLVRCQCFSCDMDIWNCWKLHKLFFSKRAGECNIVLIIAHFIHKNSKWVYYVRTTTFRNSEVFINKSNRHPEDDRNRKRRSDVINSCDT